MAGERDKAGENVSVAVQIPGRPARNSSAYPSGDLTLSGNNGARLVFLKCSSGTLDVEYPYKTAGYGGIPE